MKSSVLFIEPPRVFWFVMGEYLPPPSSLLILAAYVERELPEVNIEIVDCQAEQRSWKKLEKYIESTTPSMVLTSGFTTNAYSCARTCEIAKTVSKDIITVVGGIHFSFTAEESLRKYPEIDYIVRGEGEQTIVDLITTIQNNGKVNEVQGISYRKNTAIVHTPARPLLKNLDTLPYPAYHLVEKNLSRYHFSLMAGRNTRYMILEGARGCEHQCSFCTQWKHWGSQWRTKSAKRIADEIEYLHNTFGGRFIWFADDNMRLGVRGQQLYEALQGKPCTEEVMLFFQTRTDDVTQHPDLIGNLRKVGTYWILCGVESNSEERLQEYKKGIIAQDAFKAIQILKEHDVFSQAMFVIGARNDTHESIEQLRQFSVDLAPDIAIFTTLTPFPGTIYYETAKQNGWIEDTNYAHYDMVHAIMPTETLTRKQVQEELWRCYQRFYGSWSRGVSGVFAKNKLKRRMYQHMAGQFVLKKLKRLI